MPSIALPSFKKRCVVPPTIQVILKNSILKIQGPLGKAELQLKTYDKKGSFSVKLIKHPQAHQELHFRALVRQVNKLYRLSRQLFYSILKG